MWVRRDERTLFRCNPCVLFIDFTANTNVEKKPFFMGTGVTATNESVVVFRALTPNEKLQWTDNIMSALPRLLGAATFKKVSMGIGDECGNEIKCVPYLTSLLRLCHLLAVITCSSVSFNCLSFFTLVGPGKRAVRTTTMAQSIGFVACTRFILARVRKHSLVNFTTSRKVPPGCESLLCGMNGFAGNVNRLPKSGLEERLFPRHLRLLGSPAVPLSMY